jgi:hypothetical protein
LTAYVDRHVRSNVATGCHAGSAGSPPSPHHAPTRRPGLCEAGWAAGAVAAGGRRDERPARRCGRPGRGQPAWMRRSHAVHRHGPRGTGHHRHGPTRIRPLPPWPPRTAARRNGLAHSRSPPPRHGRARGRGKRGRKLLPNEESVPPEPRVAATTWGSGRARRRGMTRASPVRQGASPLHSSSTRSPSSARTRTRRQGAARRALPPSATGRSTPRTGPVLRALPGRGGHGAMAVEPGDKANAADDELHTIDRDAGGAGGATAPPSSSGTRTR